MAICGIVLGAVGALALLKVARHRRCGGGGRWHGRWHRGGFRHGGGMPIWWIARRLDLNEAQRDALIGVAGRLHDTIGGHRHVLRTGAQAVAAESFDRAKVDQFLSEKRGAIVDALEQVHDILTDDQRAKLRTLLGVEKPPASGGPYRT